MRWVRAQNVKRAHECMLKAAPITWCLLIATIVGKVLIRFPEASNISPEMT